MTEGNNMLSVVGGNMCKVVSNVLKVSIVGPELSTLELNYTNIETSV